MKCPVCKEFNHVSDAIFCHMCGSRLVKLTNTKGIIVTILIIFAVLAVLTGIVVIYSNNQPLHQRSSSSVPSVVNYEQKVTNIVQTLCDATINNNYNRIAELYAFNVKRYHNIYDVTNAEVVERYRKYDSKFGVYSKQASIRWNTLQIWKNTNGYSVVYIEDYHIERENKSKYSDFVLEKHIELNTDFKIVSEYDVQLSKSK